MRHTRLDRLVAECGAELPDFSHVAGGPTPAMIAAALLESGNPMDGGDADYCRAVADGDRDDDEGA